MGKRILFVDTETGGLDPAQHSILSLGAVVYQDGEVLDRFYSVVNEGINLSVTPGALKVNGFTVDSIERDGLLPTEVLYDLGTFMKRWGLTKDVTLAGHNVNFDIGFIKRLFDKGGWGAKYTDVFSYRSIDTMAIAGFLSYAKLIKTSRVSLDNLLTEFHLKREEKDHNALEDAELAAKVFTAMVGLVSNPTGNSSSPYPDVV